MTSRSKPIVIAGPCMAESWNIMDEVAEKLSALSTEFGFEFYFKASFDKANRSSSKSYRGPGLETSLPWFQRVKEKYQCKLITDIHEKYQAPLVGELFDAIQIPAFLCRQTDLLEAALNTRRMVNIKKGQFMAPGAMEHIVDKVRHFCAERQLEVNASLTERGVCFGYGDLIVDPRSFSILAKNNIPVLFDITHSTQNPPTGTKNHVSEAQRCFAPLLARSAIASGYLDGVFLEVHPNPHLAKSDAAAQLSLDQATELLKQIVPIWHEAKKWKKIDHAF